MSFQRLMTHSGGQRIRKQKASSVEKCVFHIFMAALRIADADIIFLPCSFFYLLLSFFPRLVSAVADWMCAILILLTFN